MHFILSKIGILSVASRQSHLQTVEMNTGGLILSHEIGHW